MKNKETKRNVPFVGSINSSKSFNNCILNTHLHRIQTIGWDEMQLLRDELCPLCSYDNSEDLVEEGLQVFNHEDHTNVEDSEESSDSLRPFKTHLIRSFVFTPVR